MDVKAKKKIIKFFSSFKEAVREQKWLPRYDAEADSLSFRVEKLPNNARIKYIGDEIALYLTPSYDVKGIFIEYFTSNFLQHYSDFKEIKSDISLKTKDERKTVNLSKRKMSKSLDTLEAALLDSFADGIEFQKYNFK